MITTIWKNENGWTIESVYDEHSLCLYPQYTNEGPIPCAMCREDKILAVR
jgi:hypothetical protein